MEFCKGCRSYRREAARSTMLFQGDTRQGRVFSKEAGFSVDIWCCHPDAPEFPATECEFFEARP